MTRIIVMAAVALLTMAVTFMAEAENDCRVLIEELDQKTSQLGEYVSAMGNAHRMRDHKLAEALNAQIDQILIEIRAAEVRLRTCTGKVDILTPPLASVKSEENEFSTLSCDDLRKKHMQLSRKINSLARRSESVLTEMTPEHKAEYGDTQDQLAKVEQLLKSKCTVPEPKKNIRRRQ